MRVVKSLEERMEDIAKGQLNANHVKYYTKVEGINADYVYAAFK